jgi:dihydropyrimidinase
MSYDLVIKNGTVVTASAVFQADVAVQGSRITALGKGLQGTRVIDAGGKYVLPGGVDIHVHMDLRLPGDLTSSDTFFTGTRAAALGGTTAIVDFVEAEAGQALMEALQARRNEADAQVAIDYGLHMTISPPDLAKLVEVPIVVEAGCPTFKLYMAYGLRLNDGELLQALRAIHAAGGLAVVHAENWEVITSLIGENLRAGRREPRWHPRSRPALLEGEATGRVIDIAEYLGAPVHIFHVSCAAAAERITQARQRGLPVSGETCPQYLFLNEQAFEAPGVRAALPVCSPPIRTSSDQEALWRALSQGELQIVTTDHCPFWLEQKERGWKVDFSKIPGGVPSIEMRMAAIYSGGVRQGLLTLSRWVESCCTRPAKLAGFNQKGEVAVGHDADLVVFDPELRKTLSTETLHENVDWTPYEGLELQGWPVTTLSRGRVIVEDGEFCGEAGWGRFVARML